MTSRAPEIKPKWNRLKDMNCPKCGKQLLPVANKFMWACPDLNACGFKITEVAFTRVIKQLYRGGSRSKAGRDDVAALEYLNNYGHNKQSADFSGDESLADEY